MARRFKPLTPERIGTLPPGCAGCVFWESSEPLPHVCGARCDAERARAWVEQVYDDWGECGRVAFEDGEALGFVKYAPAVMVPQAANMPSGPPADHAVLVTCMHIEPEARQRGLGKVLMQAALRDLATRGERTVQAYATTSHGQWDVSPMIGVEFLLRMGFTVARPHPSSPLMQLDLKSLAAWTENVETVLESLRIPLRVPARAPMPNIRENGGA